MKLYLAGAEIPSHRKVLTEFGAKNAALSFMGLRRRIKHPENWFLAEKFPEGIGLLLDSGAYTVNRSPMDYTQADLQEISDSYQQFVAANLLRVDSVIEFDALALGRDWIEAQREDFYDDLGENFIPIWHPEWGVDYLQEMADRYSNIGIPTTDLSGRNLTPVLNQIAARDVSLHGVSMTHIDEMQSIKWYSVSSTSWVSPQQYGDTIVWTGRELKRYPKKYKDQARRRYRTLFEREGFDAEKISNDDSTELLRLSIWSWERFVDDIDNKANRGLHVVATPSDNGSEDIPEVDGVEVDTETGEIRNPVSTPAIRKVRDTTALPVLGITSTTVENEETGESDEVKKVGLRSTSQRKCETCFLATKCPAFDPGSNCAYDIPLQVKTRDDFTNLYNSMLEMQAQRVMFMRFAEEIEGGYADPNLSGEVDRLTKMMKVKADMESDTFSMTVTAKRGQGGDGQPGMLSRLFGEQASQKARALEGGPIAAEDAAAIIDVEVIEDTRK